MATRSIINLKDDEGTILTIYKHWDGYPQGLGKKLVELKDSIKMINGLTNNTEDGKIQINGFDDFIAYLIWYLKEGVSGDVYINRPIEVKNITDYWNDYFIDYVYEINKDLSITCYDATSGKKIDLENILNKNKIIDFNKIEGGK